MSNFKKIFEIRGGDWLKGFSAQGGLSLGGIFQYASGFHPWKLAGYLKPSLASTELTAPADSIKNITSWNASGVGYFYAHTNTKLYQYLVASPYTQTDVTAQITPEHVAGAILFQNKYCYAYGGGGNINIYSNSLPVNLGSETVIASSSNYSSISDAIVRPMCIGADANLYVGDYGASSGGVIRITTALANTAQLAAFAIDAGFTVRDMVDDGKYLVIIADNNNPKTTSRVVGNYQCKVYFWDMGKPTADVIWDIKDSYLIGAKFFDNKTYIWGYNGVYVTNVVTQPKQIWDFNENVSAPGLTPIMKRPLNPYQISVGPNDIFWADGAATGQLIYALRGPVFFSPYQTHQSVYAHTAISAISDMVVAAVDAPKLYINNVGTTMGNATVETTVEALPQPYTYGYIKVVLQSPLSAGQSVTLNAYNSNGTVILNTSTKSFSADGAKKSLIFTAKPVTGGVVQFDDIYVLVNPVGAIIERMTVYGTPLDDLTQS